MAELTVRRFDGRDMPRCTQIAIDAWENVEEEHVDSGAWETYLRHFLAKSNWAEVVCDSDLVVGLLFGRIDIKGRERPFKKEGASVFRLTREILLGEFELSHGIIPVLWTFVMTELKLKLNMPRSDSEIIMFVLDENYRGMGVGRLMVDRFAKAARDSGALLMTVYTEDQISNWQFYEKYGFKKVGSFYNDLDSYFIGRKSTAMIYALDLDSSKK